MPGINQPTSYFDYSSNTLTSQSILDIFILQDLIEPEDASNLKKRFHTNREIENFLVKNRIVSKDTVNKAYSILLKLPYVELSSVAIPEELKKIVSLSLIRKYGIIPFSMDDGVVRIAISRPADLLVSFKTSLGQIFAEKNFEIELFITGDSDFNEVLKQYSGKDRKDVLMKKGSLPVVYLRNRNIASEYLAKMPKEFVDKYRMVVFGQNHKGQFLLACETPDSPVTRKIIDFTKRENGVKFEVFATSKDDIDYVLDQYVGREPAKEEFTPESVAEEPSKIADQKVDIIAKEPEKLPKKSAGQKSSFRGLLSSLLESNEPEITIDQVVKKDANPGAGAVLSKDEVAGSIAKLEQEKQEADDLQEETPVKKKSEDPDLSGDNIVDKSVDNLAILTSPKADETSVEEPNLEESAAEGGPTGDMGTTLDNKDLGSLLKNEVRDEKDLEAIGKTGSVPEIVASVIDFALNNRSSDIHVEPEAKALRIRCRVDGILKDVLKLPSKYHAPFVSRIKIMSKLKIDESRIPQDGRFDTVFDKREVDVRVSTLPTVHGEKIVMRILDKSQGILSLEDLGMQGSAFDATNEAIKKPYGIILSTGPTGSGKSTTLYAILNRISLPGVNIVTLEDPVEYEIPGINQCQIKPEIGFTFAAGLRSILRQDPNIIMVGEIRDAETAGMATHAALTGHLVLSTLHTNDTAGALPRLINMGVEPFLITSSINLVIAQRLVRRICPKCKEEVKVPQKLMDQLVEELNKIPATNVKDRSRVSKELKLYYGRGCNECNHGFKGRIGIYEVMEITPEIEDLAVAKKPANEIKEASIKSGMITMKQDGIIKAFEGLTTIDEVFQAVVNS